MKNIHTILSELGITIPEDKKAEFDKDVAENYKTSVEHEKKVNRLTEELNAEKERADEAAATLKGFEGKDFDAIQKDRDEWKKKHEETVAKYAKEKEDREFDDSISAAITEAKGKNAKAIIALLDVEKLRGSKNQQADIKAALDSLRANSGYLFDDNGGAAHFTGNKGTGDGGKSTTLHKMSMADYIAARKNM